MDMVGLWLNIFHLSALPWFRFPQKNVAIVWMWSLLVYRSTDKQIHFTFSVEQKYWRMFVGAHVRYGHSNDIIMFPYPLVIFTYVQHESDSIK